MLTPIPHAHEVAAKSRSADEAHIGHCRAAREISGLGFQ